MSALRKRLLDVFQIEYQEHLEAIRQMLAAPAAGTDQSGFQPKEATRRAHSLKGAARAVGLDLVETLAHKLETVFVDVEKGEAPFDEDLRRFIADSLDDIEDGVVASQQADADRSEPPPAGSEPVRQEPVNGVLVEPPASGEAALAVENATLPPVAEAARSMAQNGASPARNPSAQDAYVRVNADNLDRLLKSAGELHADMLFQNLNSMEASRLGNEMAALENRWNRTWKQVELAIRRGDRAGITSILSHGEQLTSEIKGLSRRLRAAAQRQSKGARSLHHHLDDLERRVRSARMMPAESVFAGFRKMIRDVAASEGKQVDVVIEGLDCQADRLVLQRIKDPVMHVLRNAVSHGIEMPSDREHAGKPARGRVALRVSNEHDRLKVIVEDDGRGIDLRRVADKAVATGLLTREDADAASSEALIRLVFESGFSTAEDVTKISGRGVGLSVAHDAVVDLQGTFDVHSNPGEGTRIEIALPLSVLSRRLLLVSFRDQIYALPAESVARVMRVPTNTLVTIEGRPAARLADSTLPLVSIGELLGSDTPNVATDAESVCIAVVRTGAAHAANATHIGVAVEGFVGVNDFVVRSLEAARKDSRLWSGIISTEDGAPCLVLNPAAFVRHELGASDVIVAAEHRETDQAKVVLVVDDSITTRTLEKSILEAHGYEVRLSVDGRDALNVLRSNPPSIVVSDVEMPHVDGFQLVHAMKNDQALARIPIILVTSRDDQKDREKGLRLGADAYVIKQKFDQNELLRTIRQIV